MIAKNAPNTAPTDWHARTDRQVGVDLAVDVQRGLAAADATARLARHGENRLPETARRPGWLRLVLQFHNPLIYVLLGAGTVTLVLRDYIDAIVIFAVVLINAAIGFVQEGKAERALDAVRNMLALRATVLRDGQRCQIDAALLVPGDLVLLESGDKVPADLRLVRIRNLRVVESALTGESLPVEKHVEPVAQSAVVADRACMAFSGTLVAYGQAQGIVVETGPATEIGRSPRRSPVGSIGSHGK